MPTPTPNTPRARSGLTTGWRHRAASVALLLAAAGVQFTAPAHGESLLPTSINALIEQLNADSFVDREEATRRLIDLQGDLEPLVVARLRAGDCSPEQLVRIETILQTRFLEAPRAALGVGFTPPARNANNVPIQKIPVILNQVMAGFPCAATLRPGDIIRVVDGIELPPTEGGDMVRRAILSHLPGEEIELLIERDGRRSFVRVPLGRYADLRNPSPSSDMVQSAWELRRARLGLMTSDLAPPITCVSGEGRAELPNLPQRRAPAIESGGAPDNGAALLHMLRSSASALSANRIAATRNVQQPAVNARLMDRRRVLQPGKGKEPEVTPEALIARMQAVLDSLLKQRERYMQIVNRDDISHEQRQNAILQLTEVEANIAEVKNEITNLQKAGEAVGDDKNAAPPQDD